MKNQDRLKSNRDNGRFKTQVLWLRSLPRLLSCHGYLRDTVTFVPMVTFVPRLHSCDGYLRATITFVAHLPSCHGYFRDTVTFVTRLPSSHGYLRATFTFVPRLPTCHVYLRATVTFVSRLPSCHAYFRATVTFVPRLLKSQWLLWLIFDARFTHVHRVIIFRSLHNFSLIKIMTLKQSELFICLLT